MSASVHVYTSITSNYLPKARVLAHSIKKIDASVQFHLVLSDSLPIGFDLASEPFDNIIYAEDLITKDFPQWAFGHEVVEMCTAVKGVALVFNSIFYTSRNKSFSLILTWWCSAA